MRIINCLLILGLMTVMIGCESSPFVVVESGPFELTYGQTVYVPGPKVRLTFTGEVDDSRCCMVCFCFWPGYASITVTLKHNNQTSEIQLTTVLVGNPSPTEYVDTLGYRFKLINLSPYPETGPYPNEDYTATIEVTPVPVVSILPSVQIVDNPPSEIELYPYDLDSARIVDGRITLWVNYGGGCEAHYFQLYMTPAAFMESQPPQANLYLKHFGPPDYCKAYVHQKIEFGLAPIIQMFHSEVGGGGGELRLNLINCTDPSQPPMPCDQSWSGTFYVPSLPD